MKLCPSVDVVFSGNTRPVVILKPEIYVQSLLVTCSIQILKIKFLVQTSNKLQTSNIYSFLHFFFRLIYLLFYIYLVGSNLFVRKKSLVKNRLYPGTNVALFSFFGFKRVIFYTLNSRVT